MAQFPLSHVRQQREVGGPLPVEYVELVAWFYPGAGDGMLILVRRREDGTEDTLSQEHRVERRLGPFDADQTIPEMARLWATGVRRMTGWKHLGQVFGSEPEPASED